MWSTAREIAPGDLVIIWLVSFHSIDNTSPCLHKSKTRDVIQPLLITPGKDFNSKYGHYRHADLVGIPYGSKVASRKGKGFIHVLRPTPELWTMALPHRTQILYLADIAFITSYLNIKRGSRVIEAGAYLCNFRPTSFIARSKKKNFTRLCDILNGSFSVMCAISSILPSISIFFGTTQSE